MKYSDLTAPQKDLIQSFMDSFRPVMGEFARTLSKMTAVVDFYAGGTSVLIDGLDAAEPILTVTGLAGAQTLAKEDIQTFMSVLGVLLNAYDQAATRSTYIKIAGINASMP